MIVYASRPAGTSSQHRFWSPFASMKGHVVTFRSSSKDGTLVELSTVETPRCVIFQAEVVMRNSAHEESYWR